jgi:aquaporin Z
MYSKIAAEFIGTFWLVLGGCGSAVLAAAFPQVGIGLLGVSFAFGLTVLCGWAIEQLWLFWVAPIVGAAVAGFAYRLFLEEDVAEPPISGR